MRNLYTPDVEKLQMAIRAVLRQLRGGFGFDEAKFDRLFEVLEECAVIWRGSETLPRLAVSLLVDLERVIENCSYPYSDAKREKIQSAAYKVGELIAKIVPWEGPPV